MRTDEKRRGCVKRGGERTRERRIQYFQLNAEEIQVSP